MCVLHLDVFVLERERPKLAPPLERMKACEMAGRNDVIQYSGEENNAER
jgi:hypothetical protein